MYKIPQLRAEDYTKLKDVSHRRDYLGYRIGREHLEVSGVSKYVADICFELIGQHKNRDVFIEYMRLANDWATGLAQHLKVPEQYMPKVEHSILRVLKYVPGSGTGPHYDQTMFTLPLYRNVEGLKTLNFSRGYEDIMYQNPGLQFGLMWKDFGFGEPTLHEVPQQNECQYSIVYLVRPDITKVRDKNGERYGSFCNTR